MSGEEIMLTRNRFQVGVLNTEKDSDPMFPTIERAIKGTPLFFRDSEIIAIWDLDRACEITRIRVDGNWYRPDSLHGY